MRNVLIFAAIAGIAAAIGIYVVTERDKDAVDYIEDAAEDAYDTMDKHINKTERRTRRAFDAMS